MEEKIENIRYNPDCKTGLTKEQIDEYIKSLSEFYKIRSTTIDKELLNIDDIRKDNILQIIPNKKKNKFEKESLTLLSINT